jgi:type I restriction enzyme, S subunit
MRKDWIEVELGEVCSFIGGGTPSKSNPSYWSGNIPWASIKDIKGSFLNNTEDFISEVGLKNSASNLALDGDIILATRINPGRPILSKIKVAINQDLKIVKPLVKFSPRFLFYLFKEIEPKVLKLSSGTTVLGINLTNLKSILIPLPPLPEQRAIVVRIEELFSELDHSISNLKSAQAKLEIYRQAVLKKAFEGGFNAESDQQKYKDLPIGWGWKSIKELSTVLGDGLHGTPKYSENGEYFFINGNNLNDIRIEIKPNTKRVNREEFEKYKKPLNERTVFVSINGTLGNTAFYNGEKVILGKSACYFNLIDSVSKEYVLYVLKTSRFVNYANTEATGSTIKNVSLKSMRGFLIPLPKTIEEQTQIVQEIESRLSVADKMAETIQISLQKAEALRQSILKKAFEGKLLTESELEACRKEADWEPAEKLLERIKQETSKPKKS